MSQHQFGTVWKKEGRDSVCTAGKLYQCQKCGRTFSWREILQHHQRIHLGEKPCKCHECGMTFSHRWTLKCHQRTHSVEKLYKCQECGMTFCESGTLKCYQRTHSRKTPVSTGSVE